jgi:hypothetical protein
MCQIFFNSVGKEGTLAIWAFMIITLWMTGMDYVRFYIYQFHQILMNRLAAYCRITPAVRLFAGPWSSAV